MLNNKLDRSYEIEHENINGKFEFTFGIIWTISFILIAIINLISSNGNSGAILMFMVFIGVGILFIHTGAKKIKADKNTETFGEECYGKVYELSKMGEVNGNSLYDARIIVYIPSEDCVKILNEAIGYDNNKFPEDSYLELKYYENDINIKKVVNESYISKSVINKINEFKYNINEEEIEEYHYSNIDNNYKNNQNTNYISSQSIKIDENVMKVSGIIQIAIGAIWIFILSIILIGFSLDFGENIETTYFVNGEQVTKEEFESSMIIPKILLGIFMVPGIIVTISGITCCLKSNKNGSTSKQNIFEEYDNYKIREESDDFDPIQRRK